MRHKKCANNELKKKKITNNIFIPLITEYTLQHQNRQSG